VMLLGLFPLYLWVVGNSHGLPIWPAFAGYTGLSSALPVIQSSISLLAYSSTAIFIGLVTMGVFLMLGTVVWLASTSRTPRPPKTVLMLTGKSTIRSLLVCLGAGLLFNANTVAGWFEFPGNSMQVARGIASGLGFFGCFALAYLHGSGQMQRVVIFAYTTMTCLMVAFALTSLLLANAIAPITLALIGFTLGAGRIPWKAVLMLFLLISVLHPGKYAMRQIYEEDPGKQRSVGIMQMPAFYSEWISYGFDSLGGISGVFKAASKDETAPSTVFDRAGTLHMLLLVQDKSPNQVPFLDGLTYAPIPYLLVPRFFAPDKGISHAGNILLTVNYGLQDIEATQTTSIGWNLVAEAYANFGYPGVLGIAVFMGLLYGMVSRLTVGVPITSFRFVSGLIVLAGVTNDNSLGVFLTMQFQGVVGVALASVFLMRRQPNPFAAQGTSEEQRQIADETSQKRPAGQPQTVGSAKWGGYKPPKWAPLSHRKAYEVAAQRRKAEAASNEIEEKNESEGKAQRPRQVAVPIQPYYYRSRKA